MAVLFPKIYQVIRRSKGGYPGGVYTPAPEPMPQDIALNIQPANTGDYMRAESTLAGRRVTAMCRVYAEIDAGLNVAGDDDWPGDIVLYLSKRWVVIGSARWDTLGDADTAHMRYMITLEAEHGAGEVTA